MSVLWYSYIQCQSDERYENHEVASLQVHRRQVARAHRHALRDRRAGPSRRLDASRARRFRPHCGLGRKYQYIHIMIVSWTSFLLWYYKHYGVDNIDDIILVKSDNGGGWVSLEEVWSKLLTDFQMHWLRFFFIGRDERSIIVSYGT